MKILLLTLAITLSSESAVARASLAKRVVQGTQALAVSVFLLAAPIVGFAASSDLSAGVGQQTQQQSSPLSLAQAQQGESDFDGEFFRLGIVGAYDGAGLMLNGGVRYDPLTAGTAGVDVDIKLLAQRGNASFVLNAENVFHGFAFDFAQEKVGLQLFADLYLGGHEFSGDARQGVGPTVGLGLEALDDFLGQGQYTHIQLRGGVGWLAHNQYMDTEWQEETISFPQYRTSRAARERINLANTRITARQAAQAYKAEDSSDSDIDVVSTLKLIVKTDGLTLGDVLHKEHSSLWHWLTLVPKGKVSAALHKPMFDSGERHSGDLIYSLQAQVGLSRNLYLILEHYDSPNYDDVYRRASLRWHLYGTP